MSKGSVDSVTFSVEGNPKPLARAILSRGNGRSNKVWLRDPGKESKAAFRAAVQRCGIFGEGCQPRILFDAGTPIAVDIVFHIKTPQDHFINRNQASGQIKVPARTKWPGKPDIDNLDKFVLDALQGFLFANDSQVVRQSLFKRYHHEPPFMGQTVVSIHRADDLSLDFSASSICNPRRHHRQQWCLKFVDAQHQCEEALRVVASWWHCLGVASSRCVVVALPRIAALNQVESWCCLESLCRGGVALHCGDAARC